MSLCEGARVRLPLFYLNCKTFACACHITTPLAYSNILDLLYEKLLISA